MSKRKTQFADPIAPVSTSVADSCQHVNFVAMGIGPSDIAATAAADAIAATTRTIGDSKFRVLLIDDHPVTRRGLRCFIDGQPDLVVCGEAADARAAIQSAASTAPHAAVVDLALGADDGLELLKELARRWPVLATVGYSALDETTFAERAMRAGARGFVSKSADAEDLVEAVRRALRGDVALSDAASTAILRRIRGGYRARETRFSVDQLSDRELQVFTLIGQGFAPREIAERLFISVKTVESHREHIKVKLCIECSRELLRHAIRFASRHPA